MISDEDIKLAFDRVARTPDGDLIYRHFQKVLCGTATTTDSGALLLHEGRRTLARDLMAMMAQGIDDSGGRSDTTESGSGSSASERAVVFTVARAVASPSRPRGAARRVSAGEPGPGDA